MAAIFAPSSLPKWSIAFLLVASGKAERRWVVKRQISRPAKLLSIGRLPSFRKAKMKMFHRNLPYEHVLQDSLYNVSVLLLSYLHCNQLLGAYREFSKSLHLHTFSRHDITEVNFVLFIWLNENGRCYT